MSTNEYGLDASYFTSWLGRLSDIGNYTPDELARELARMSVTADSEVIHEDEFNKGLVGNFSASLEVCKDLHKKIAELQLKLNEQIAYSEKIKIDAMACCEFEMATELCDRLNQSPAQSLNKLKASAVLEYIETNWSGRGDVEEVEIWRLIRDGELYANQLLKEGE